MLTQRTINNLNRCLCSNIEFSIQTKPNDFGEQFYIFGTQIQQCGKAFGCMPQETIPTTYYQTVVVYGHSRLQPKHPTKCRGGGGGGGHSSNKILIQCKYTVSSIAIVTPPYPFPKCSIMKTVCTQQCIVCGE